MEANREIVHELQLALAHCQSLHAATSLGMCRLVVVDQIEPRIQEVLRRLLERETKMVTGPRGPS